MPLRHLPPRLCLYNVYIIIYMPFCLRNSQFKILLCGLCGFARVSFSATTSPDGAESSITPD